MYYVYLSNNWPVVPYLVYKQGVEVTCQISHVNYRYGFFQVVLKLNFLILQPSTSAGTCSFRIHAIEHLIMNDNLECLIVMSFTT